MRYLAITMPTPSQVFSQFADARELVTRILLVVAVLLLVTSIGLLIRRIRRAIMRKKTLNQNVLGASGVGVPRPSPRAADPSKRATRVFLTVYFAASCVGAFLSILIGPPWSIVGGTLYLVAFLSLIVFVSRDNNGKSNSRDRS
jgi:hypothetical protein